MSLGEAVTQWVDSEPDTLKYISRFEGIKWSTYSFGSVSKFEGKPPVSPWIDLIIKRGLVVGNYSISLPDNRGTGLCGIIALPYIQNGKIENDTLPVVMGVTIDGKFSGLFAGLDPEKFFTSEADLPGWLDTVVNSPIEVDISLTSPIDPAASYKDFPEYEIYWSLLQPYLIYLNVLSDEELLRREAIFPQTPDPIRLLHYASTSGIPNFIGVISTAVGNPLNFDE